MMTKLEVEKVLRDYKKWYSSTFPRLTIQPLTPIETVNEYLDTIDCEDAYRRSMEIVK